MLTLVTVSGRERIISRDQRFEVSHYAQILGHGDLRHRTITIIDRFGRIRLTNSSHNASVNTLVFSHAANSIVSSGRYCQNWGSRIVPVTRIFFYHVFFLLLLFFVWFGLFVVAF